MSEVITISPDEILHRIKLSCQIPSVIEGIVTRKIIAHAASEQGIKVEPSELQQAADSWRLKNHLSSADATLSWLQKHHLSLDDFEKLVHANVIASKLAQHLLADLVEPFFVEHQLDYAQVVMYEVVLDDEDLAMELFYALESDEINFHEVAHQYIQDNSLRRSGGYRGVLRLRPIVTSSGTHLILVSELIQPELDDILREKILADLFSAWLKSQIEQVEILR